MNLTFLEFERPIFLTIRFFFIIFLELRAEVFFLEVFVLEIETIFAQLVDNISSIKIKNFKNAPLMKMR